MQTPRVPIAPLSQNFYVACNMPAAGSPVRSCTACRWCFCDYLQAIRRACSGISCLACMCRPYAAAIGELLDPSGDLFGGRIIASSGTTEDGEPADQAKRLMQVRACQYLS